MMSNHGDDTLTPSGMEPERVVAKMDERLDFGVDSALAHLQVLLRMEAANYPLCKDYLSTLGDTGVKASDCVSEAWRRKLCEWCFEVVDHFSFDREVVSYALDFLDRAVAIKTEATKIALPKRDFQLMAVTSLYTAIKLHGETDEKEGPRRKLRIGAFVELSRGFFAIDVIEESERQILEALQWRVNPPTSLRFMSTMLRVCPKWESTEHQGSSSHVLGGIYDIARYLTELAICTSAVSFSCKTSVISFAAILCAFETIKLPIAVPAEARIGFIQTIASTTCLLPSDPEVARAVGMLKSLCPSMFVCEDILCDDMGDESDESSRYERRSGSFDDRDSPVCVVDTREHDASPRSPRKRRCPENDDTYRRAQQQRSSFP
ncbi:hypothetical protein MPSEU_000709500 [Mayamaea pseudoterrestris]|nr:hypothetical protein MPSEU_000709500 [Mayamaea pseudoterrestris]